MLGCVTLPIRLALLALLLVGAYLGWRNRDRIADMLGIRPPQAAVAPASRGRPTGRSLTRAIEKVDSLNGWRADSVVLSAGEMASLIGAGLPAVVRRDIDSLQVELLEDAIRIRGRIRTEGLPREVLGPFAGALHPWEPVAAAGSVDIVSPGRAEWTVTEFRVRDFQFPRDVVPRMDFLSRQETHGRLAIVVPPGIGGVRVRPSGVTLYPSGTTP
jgi:hypothetical protein